MTTPADKDAPVVVQKKAIDVTPYNHALWCSVGDSKPFANTIYWRSWSDDGTKILFGLDTHNGFSAAPDELVGVVEVRGPESAEYLAEKLREDAEKMANRPTADTALRERLRIAYGYCPDMAIPDETTWVRIVKSELSRAGGERTDIPSSEIALANREREELRAQVDDLRGQLAAVEAARANECQPNVLDALPALVRE